MFAATVSGPSKTESDGLKSANHKAKCVPLMTTSGTVIVGSENETLDWDCNSKMILIKKKTKAQQVK